MIYKHRIKSFLALLVNIAVLNISCATVPGPADNEQNPDNENVYYQSYAAKMKYFFSDFNFIIMNPFIQMTDGDNDGLCPVDSAKWGDFKGLVTSQGAFGISHAGIIDTYKVKYKGVDILNLYLEIAKELSEKGL